MVTNITSLTGNGLKDWLIQRVSAVYIAVYVFFLMGYIAIHFPLQYEVWASLFQGALMQVATSIALLMLLLHAWIGIWTVTTDYVKKTAIRLPLQMGVAFFLLAQLIWGLMILWG